MSDYRQWWWVVVLAVMLGCGGSGKALVENRGAAVGFSTATNTPRATFTHTPAPLPTDTPVPASTDTPTPLPTDTPSPVFTETPMPPTATLIPLPTETPVLALPDTPIPAPTETPLPVGPKIRIVEKNAKMEYVDIRNSGDAEQDLSGWRLFSEKGDQDCPLSGVLGPGQTLRIWAMAKDAGQGGFNCNYEGNIWNNSEDDPAVLYGGNGVEVDRVN